MLILGTIASSYPAIDDNLVAYLAATGISGTEKDAVTTINKDFKSGGIYHKGILEYPFLGGTSNTNKYNFYSAFDLDIAFRLVYTGTPTHSSAGITFDGSSNRANTFMQPLGEGLWDETGMCVAWYSNTNSVPSSAKYIWGCYPRDFGYFDASSVQGSLGNVNTNFNTGGGINTSGIFLMNRPPGSGTIRLMKNNVLIGSATQAFSSYADDNFTLGAILDVVTPFYGAINYGFFWVGEGLISTSEETVMYNAINTYKTTLGR